MESSLSFIDPSGHRVASILTTPDGDTDRIAVLCHGFLSGKNSTTNKTLTRTLTERELDAFEAMAEAKPFIEGVELIRKNFMSLLENKGVKEIEAKGKVLDVNFHEAITQVDAPGAEPDTIVEEYQTGYTLGDRVIRHAKVIVAR